VYILVLYVYLVLYKVISCTGFFCLYKGSILECTQKVDDVCGGSGYCGGLYHFTWVFLLLIQVVLYSEQTFTYISY